MQWLQQSACETVGHRQTEDDNLKPTTETDAEAVTPTNCLFSYSAVNGLIVLYTRE